jgi:hypothetical protein
MGSMHEMNDSVSIFPFCVYKGSFARAIDEYVGSMRRSGGRQGNHRSMTQADVDWVNKKRSRVVHCRRF